MTGGDRAGGYLPADARHGIDAAPVGRLWGPAGAARAFLAVYLTTLRAHSDRTCILVQGEHPFIQHDTAVAYGEVQRWPEERLPQLIAEGIAKPRQPMSAALLRRLRDGFLASPRTPHAMVSLARKDFEADS
jgi:hypothetical protein